MPGKLKAPRTVETVEEDTGTDANYYQAKINNPNRADEPYIAECSDIIEALDMNFNEGEAFKAIWRMAAERKGMKKAGNSALRDATKILHFARRILSVIRGEKVF